MTDERVLLRLLCSKRRGPHVVGRVIATANGVDLEVARAVRTGAGRMDFQAGWGRGALDGEEMDGGYVWCTTCRKALFLSGSAVREALERKVGVMPLTAVGYTRDPLGVLQRSARRRSEGESPADTLYVGPRL